MSWSHTPQHTTFRRWEVAFYRAFGGMDLMDAFRHLHPHAVDHSWFSHRGAGYRYDHTFVTSERAGHIRVCHYVHEPREQGLTDHSAMLTCLRVGDA